MKTQGPEREREEGESEREEEAGRAPGWRPRASWSFGVH